MCFSQTATAKDKIERRLAIEADERRRYFSQTTKQTCEVSTLLVCVKSRNSFGHHANHRDKAIH
jgi:hypothetical protein